MKKSVKFLITFGMLWVANTYLLADRQDRLHNKEPMTVELNIQKFWVFADILFPFSQLNPIQILSLQQCELGWKWPH